ncbi:hypothetical protein AIGOOFII_2787 [Methylobacterium marchantiae]|nr:hypothetical protein AIGOOFII_2787 [Methylobacterium marchantiae]
MTTRGSSVIRSTRQPLISRHRSRTPEAPAEGDPGPSAKCVAPAARHHRDAARRLVLGPGSPSASLRAAGEGEHVTTRGSSVLRFSRQPLISRHRSRTPEAPAEGDPEPSAQSAASAARYHKVAARRLVLGPGSPSASLRAAGEGEFVTTRGSSVIRSTRQPLISRHLSRTPEAPAEGDPGPSAQSAAPAARYHGDAARRLVLGPGSPSASLRAAGEGEHVTTRGSSVLRSTRQPLISRHRSRTPEAPAEGDPGPSAQSAASAARHHGDAARRLVLGPGSPSASLRVAGEGEFVTTRGSSVIRSTRQPLISRHLSRTPEAPAEGDPGPSAKCAAPAARYHGDAARRLVLAPGSGSASLRAAGEGDRECAPPPHCALICLSIALSSVRP